MTDTPNRSLPALPDEWRAAMAQYADAGDIAAIKEASDVAEIYRQHAKDEEQQRRGGAAKLECAFYGGQVLANDPDLGSGKTTSLVVLFPELSEPARHNLSSRWQKVYRLGREVLDSYVASATETPTYSELLSQIGGTKSSTSVEWYTPGKYIDAAREVMGGLDLDPASSPEANKIVQAPTYFTEDDNGLSQIWHGRVWLNPPYGKGTGLFADKMVAEYRADHIQEAVFLMNAYGFDASWFQQLWDYPLCFTDHRIEFYSPQRKSGGPANGNLFVYLGASDERFADIFGEFGAIVRRWP